jgi:hypothetical protein
MPKELGWYITNKQYKKKQSKFWALINFMLNSVLVKINNSLILGDFTKTLCLLFITYDVYHILAFPSIPYATLVINML